jgi:muconolactone delta-isomerase
MATIRDQRLKLRGRLVLLGQRKPLGEHQVVALYALDDLDNLAELLKRILRTQGGATTHLDEIRAWLDLRGDPTT